MGQVLDANISASQQTAIEVAQRMGRLLNDEAHDLEGGLHMPVHVTRGYLASFARSGFEADDSQSPNSEAYRQLHHEHEAEHELDHHEERGQPFRVAIVHDPPHTPKTSNLLLNCTPTKLVMPMPCLSCFRQSLAGTARFCSQHRSPTCSQLESGCIASEVQ